MAKFLLLQPHPDDLELNCGHVMHFLATSKKNHDIIVASLTKGEFGLPGPQYDKFKGPFLARVRERELQNALAIHGIAPDHLTFFGYVDGLVPFNRKIVDEVASYVRRERPDVIFAPEPRYTYYPHIDHFNEGRIVFHAIYTGMLGYTPKLYFYSSLSPNFYFGFDEAGMELTNALLACHKTQFWLLNRIKLVFKPLSMIFGRRIRWKYAEPFRQVFFLPQNAHRNKPGKIARLMLRFFWGHLSWFFAKYPEKEMQRVRDAQKARKLGNIL
ncbi:MAG TPA: PIG-L family deacetylase [Candidatus Lokiarchaeia archaeon]|nr:PIG-L family deacetylase [Candidatus Lokiarchaeia archaeon]